MAQNNKVLSDMEAENKSLRQQVLSLTLSHKLLSGRSKSVIQVPLQIVHFLSTKNPCVSLTIVWFYFSMELAEGCNKSCYSKWI